MILSNVSVPLVHLVDSTVVGHLPHAYQLGAVAVGGSLYTLMVGVLGFLRMGTTGFAAQAAGRDDGGALRLILAQGLGMALLLALLLGALALPLSGWALQLMQPSAELTGEARAFFHTRLLSLLAALATLLAGIFGQQEIHEHWPVIAALFLIGGLQLLAIGVCSEYLGRMTMEARRRPLYLIDRYLPAQVGGANP
ncbi:MATE family efflux transporter [Pseudomonas aeruginosa]|uniref:MATE family efflux transporter n=1 Tax=Pseudomonas aeruginosa TaxID=287 RepID=UPI001E2FD025|nr:MATE family efflux transporter [Pseudomonas aeruginosa]